jgi:hypothetical protein
MTIKECTTKNSGKRIMLEFLKKHRLAEYQKAETKRISFLSYSSPSPYPVLPGAHDPARDSAYPGFGISLHSAAVTLSNNVVPLRQDHFRHRVRLALPFNRRVEDIHLRQQRDEALLLFFISVVL